MNSKLEQELEETQVQKRFREIEAKFCTLQPGDMFVLDVSELTEDSSPNVISYFVLDVGKIDYDDKQVRMYLSTDKEYPPPPYVWGVSGSRDIPVVKVLCPNNIECFGPEDNVYDSWWFEVCNVIEIVKHDSNEMKS